MQMDLCYAKKQEYNITETLSGQSLGATAARGCLQECALSPLLWSLVVDNLI
jgi:hypothetical protein